MDKLSQDFQTIYNIATGTQYPDPALPWVEDASGPDTEFSGAYREIWLARESLCGRFGLEWHDADLERIMFAILDLERDLAWRMFCYGIRYGAERPGVFGDGT